MSKESVLEIVNEETAESVPVQGEVVLDEPTAEAATEQVDVVEQLQAELATAQAKIAELTDKLQRNAAEYLNSRRRLERQLNEEIERASSHLLRRILPVIDDLNLAFANLPASIASDGAESAQPNGNESQQAWVDGLRQIQKKLVGLLEEEGVTAIPTSGPFDPTRHEAIASEDHEDVPSGHIIDTLRTGYEFKGRVLRPALVRVAT